ncbi:hypothetical protein N475_08200 [Pseudoalteromonas luteoviolacea DSM 6061]|uniref:Uncharacterized protein n=1 Tax=Pseudoalteromonas luteoviolacea DSM 6061 TaxID=1365250 RepID=A0A166Z9D1_9GAMM|nr:hypothetical protein N475_08200 [Pseudoalteromonas luteoviolacea DSM 6061]MBE0386193.1 hypothetical protein [Pseudoalteromonas luteoviolacea DSM 6061]
MPEKLKNDNLFINLDSHLSKYVFNLGKTTTNTERSCFPSKSLPKRKNQLKG